MSARARREVGAAGLSFLDCICCGFGAVILLLVIVQVHDPVYTAEQRLEISSVIAQLEAQIANVGREREALETELAALRVDAARSESESDALAARLAQLLGSVEGARGEAAVIAELKAAARRAEQQLTTEAERARRHERASPDAAVGGIPADSEYVIFVIDTSGSMQQYSWSRVVQKVGETLAVYPKLKGIQVLNDEGIYMFEQYAGRWIPDSANRRGIILQQLRTWRPFSDSSPVEGIEAAIRTFHSPGKEISLYVFGDDFSGGSVQAVLDEVAHLNRADARGRRRVRIHAVGFPLDINHPEALRTSRRFASLMRQLCAENGGTFVGL